jgi:hypothetical protein
MTLLRAAVALAVTGASSASFATEPVSASFDRMLAHQAAPTGRADPARTDVDPLVAAIVVPLRDGTAAPTSVRAAIAGNATDPVAESFARMLSHEPGRFAPARPAGDEADPLIAAIVLPLLRTGHLAVAASAPVARE